MSQLKKTCFNTKFTNNENKKPKPRISLKANFDASVAEIEYEIPDINNFARNYKLEKLITKYQIQLTNYKN